MHVERWKDTNKMLWGENRGKWKGQQSPGVKSRTPLVWAASALPLSHNSRTTTNPHNPLYVLHRWYWMPQSYTWQPLSMCHSVCASIFWKKTLNKLLKLSQALTEALHDYLPPTVMWVYLKSHLYLSWIRDNQWSCLSLGYSYKPGLQLIF